MTTASSQKHPLLGPTRPNTQSGQPFIWVLMTPSRMDSRTLLKILIFLNVSLAVYLVFSMGGPSTPSPLPLPSYRVSSPLSAPCVVIMNNTTNSNIQVIKSAVNEQDEREFHQIRPDFEDLPLPESPKVKDTIGIPAIVMGVQQPQIPPGGDSMDDDSKSMPQSPWWTSETRSSYTVINNYVIADGDVANDSVTLTTQGSYEFLKHAILLCQRWEGHISLAVYAPGDDLKTSLELIYFFRKCRDPCVSRRISWHIIYDSLYGPSLGNITFPDTMVSDYRQLPCNTSDDDALSFFITTNREGLSFRELNSLPYPINVARNVARLQARTKFLLASDIELYPSLNIVTMFKDLMRREEANQVAVINRNIPHVYHLPIFEVKAGLSPPGTKEELRDMFSRGDAIFFHKFVCDICQNYPDRDLWMNLPSNGTLNVFRVTKRTRQRNSWEPLYIGTNSEPLYDERLTWEGKRDKMSQMYEMCLMNYDIMVLDNAFLVHAPGIKVIDKEDNNRRLSFIKRNNAVYNTIMAKLRKQFKVGSGGPTHC